MLELIGEPLSIFPLHLIFGKDVVQRIVDSPMAALKPRIGRINRQHKIGLLVAA